MLKKIIIIIITLIILSTMIFWTIGPLFYAKKIDPVKTQNFVPLQNNNINIAQKIINISANYLNTPYKANTLSPGEPEELIINKQELDCFTFLDYVISEAFEVPVQEIRYSNSIVSYETRNHYFADWIENNQKYVFLVSPKTQDFSILETGDLIGYYSEKPDLDVSHVGIILIKNNQVYLRHASSKHNKVLDEKLEPRDLVVLRPFKELVEPKIKTNLQYIKYNAPDKCLLQKQVALMLEQAQEYLPEHNFLIYDCLRPISIQKKIWDSLENKPEQKLFANPYKTISIHSYGAAVDLTIEGLDMGSEFDSLDPPVLTQEQILNRELLKNIIKKAGFKSIKSEWWHFNAFDLKTIKQKYNVS